MLGGREETVRNLLETHKSRRWVLSGRDGPMKNDRCCGSPEGTELVSLVGMRLRKMQSRDCQHAMHVGLSPWFGLARDACIAKSNAHDPKATIAGAPDPHRKAAFASPIAGATKLARAIAKHAAIVGPTRAHSAVVNIALRNSRVEVVFTPHSGAFSRRAFATNPVAAA
jgi:hypothetical protein